VLSTVIPQLCAKRTILPIHDDPSASYEGRGAGDAAGEEVELARVAVFGFHLFFERKARFEGYPLDFGSHDVDWLRWLGGEVKTVLGNVYRVREGIAADDHGAALFRFVRGAMATVENSWSSYLSESTFGVIGTRGAMMVDRNGTVRKKVGHDGTEEVVDIEAASAVDPTGRSAPRTRAEASVR
jgi:predicted dehydrogenase